MESTTYNFRNFMVSGAKVEMKFWILSVAFILAEIIHLAESQCRRCDQSITGKEIIYNLLINYQQSHYIEVAQGDIFLEQKM